MPFFGGSSNATDARNAATDDARIRVVSGKSAKYAEGGGVVVTDGAKLNTGLSLGNIQYSSVTIDGGSAALAASNERFASAVEALAAANTAAPVAAQVTGQVAGQPEPETAADLLAKAKTFWSNLSTGAKLAVGAAAALAVYLLLRRR